MFSGSGSLAVGTGNGQSRNGIELLGPTGHGANRLFIISAGNVRSSCEAEYRAKCDLTSIEDPARAWNAVTFGACTEPASPPAVPSLTRWKALARLMTSLLQLQRCNHDSVG
jgi:hypothetical protein